MYGLLNKFIPKSKSSLSPLIIFLLSFNLYSADINVALTGTATQSSTGWDGIASKAIDNNTNGDYFGGNSVTHTLDTTQYEWWQVDLGSIKAISKIELFNRTDCCGERLKNVYVLVSDTPFTNGTTLTALTNARTLSDWQGQVGGTPGNLVSFNLNNSGRYVLIQKSGTNETNYLSLAEVKVWTSTPSFSIESVSLSEGNAGYSNMNFTVTLSQEANATVDFNTSDITAIKGSDYNTTNGKLIFTSTGSKTQTISVPMVGDTIIEPNEAFLITLSNASGASIATASATGTIINDDYPKGYCEEHNITQSGYYIIDPDGDNNSTNAFEIYCDVSNLNNIKDIIKLPLSKEMKTTEFSNFKFNASLGDTNYYNDAHSKTYINYIRINANTLEIIPDNTTGFFDGNFSSLNLRGTPFTLDWDKMTDSNITGCALNKMRRDYDTSTKKGGQVLKINPKTENVYQCQGNKLQLKLLSDYKFINYNGIEILEKTCKKLSEALPNTAEYDNMTGYFYIDPKLGGRTNNQSLSDYRPFVSYCMEVAGSNPEDQYAWTMFLTLDGVRTENHSDITAKKDTCTNLGLFFFVPNTSSTFGKAKTFLYDQKAQWAPYTGKMGEYFTDRNIAGWGTSYETTRDYWPYGPFGLYYDDGSTTDGKLDPGEAGSWTPITGGVAVNGHTYGYDLTSSSEVNTTSINIAHINTGTGWKTTLEELGYPADFWISTFSAGDFYNSAPICTGGNTIGCYINNSRSREPNGDYTYGNWMHFWADDNGDIYHYNDQGYAGTINDRYRHDHYMCIADDNYNFVKRYDLLAGPFKTIEHSVASGSEVANTTLTTKIVNETLHFDIALLTDNLSAVQADKNTSVGIFLNDTYTPDGFTETPRDVHYFGDIKRNGLGTFNALKTTGRFELPASSWPSGVQTWSSANKRLFFKFKYCSRSDYEWTQCWTPSGVTATCTVGQEAYCRTADSNDFAIRPKNFDFGISGTSPYKAGVGYSTTFDAKDYNNNATSNYNEAIPLTYNESKVGCITGNFNSSLVGMLFVNGTKNIPSLSYSEVGVINIKMEETLGSEFALVDATDTSSAQRLITPYDQNWSYTPDHFALTSSHFDNNATGFTYLSSDLNMSANLNLTIIAQNLSNATTQNYNSACYSKTTSYGLSYTPLVISPSSALSRMNYLETNTSISGNIPINNTWNIASIPNTIFSTYNNGIGQLNIKVNFDRNSTKTVNPFIFTARDINVTDADGVLGGIDLNQNTTFYYGRAHAPDYRFPNRDGNATIYYEVYCKDCTQAMRNTMGITGNESVNALNWYQNTLHVSTAGLAAPVPAHAGNFSNTGITHTNPITTQRLTLQNATSIPYVDKVNLNSSTWLIYYPTDFSVEFYSAGSWAGAGFVKEGQPNATDTNTTVGEHIHKAAPIKANRRITW